MRQHQMIQQQKQCYSGKEAQHVAVKKYNIFKYQHIFGCVAAASIIIDAMGKTKWVKLPPYYPRRDINTLLLPNLRLVFMTTHLSQDTVSGQPKKCSGLCCLSEKMLDPLWCGQNTWRISCSPGHTHAFYILI